jgi:hypothetical protein
MFALDHVAVAIASYPLRRPTPTSRKWLVVARLGMLSRLQSRAQSRRPRVHLAGVCIPVIISFISIINNKNSNMQCHVLAPRCL